MTGRADALENARTERDHAARLRAGLRTSLTPDLDMDRIRRHEAAARTYEAIVRDSIRETDDR